MQAVSLAETATQFTGMGASTVGNVISADVTAKIPDIQSRTIADKDGRSGRIVLDSYTATR
ncbi:MAG: hypothetical protein QM706_15890 [Nitrospira sp.]